MNRIITSCLTAFALLIGANAIAIPNDWVLPAADAYTQDYQVYINSTGAITNQISVTNAVDGSLYHTFHIYNTGTNQLQYVIDKSMDTTNYVAGATNVVAAGANVEAAITGKEGFFRVRTFATNDAFQIDYLGGR